MMEQAFIDFKSRNAQLERRKGVRIKGGVGPQERGSRKIEKEEQERKKKREQNLYSILLCTLYLEKKFFLIKLSFFNHLCPSNVLTSLNKIYFRQFKVFFFFFLLPSNKSCPGKPCKTYSRHVYQSLHFLEH